ncbi:phosphatidylinositol 4-kinase gamma 5-like [Pyrus ussuriensis x Pyrus communis]|uniref:Phosphatidylinositol 4-kinase gamma 5-like n=1 Tax=Pyrus ussuriensis x Pyrus communis TaxID=2448454 RepID=A0A5N5I0C3_9ROSA|nr:phosphatidylinositol 4-kinase gamma 5-like [Pyrus ussuriensis x Pyrus communis]
MCLPFASDLSLMDYERDAVGDVAWSRGEFACGFAWSLRVRRGPWRCGGGLEEKPSELEAACLDARKNIAYSNLTNFEAEQGNEEFLFDMDCENAGILDPSHVTSSCFFDQVSYPFGSNRRNLLSKQDETLEEDEDRAEGITSQPNWHPTASKLSMPPKRTDVDGRSRRSFFTPPLATEASKNVVISSRSSLRYRNVDSFRIKKIRDQLKCRNKEEIVFFVFCFMLVASI